MRDHFWAARHALHEYALVTEGRHPRARRRMMWLWRIVAKEAT